MRTSISAATTTNLGVLVLVGAAIWTAADRWFGYQNNVAAQMATMNERLVKIEARLATMTRHPASD